MSWIYYNKVFKTEFKAEYIATILRDHGWVIRDEIKVDCHTETKVFRTKKGHYAIKYRIVDK